MQALAGKGSRIGVGKAPTGEDVYLALGQPQGRSGRSGRSGPAAHTQAHGPLSPPSVPFPLPRTCLADDPSLGGTHQAPAAQTAPVPAEDQAAIERLKRIKAEEDAEARAQASGAPPAFGLRLARH